MLEFNILKGQYLNRLDKDVVSADTTDLKAQFDLTSDFTGTITVWWRRSDVNNTYTSTLAADGTCTIPAEALAATDKAVYGPYDHDVFVSISDTGRTTTNEYKLTVQRSAFSTDATPGTGGSPTAYEELVEQFDELKEENQAFKDDMTQQQETLESTVTENVDNIRYIVETETAPPIIEEASGAEITLDDSAYRQVRGLQLYGYSKQVTTTGAQLLDSSNFPTSGYGITLSIDDDGWIVLNGTSTDIVIFTARVDTPFSGNVYYSVNNDSANNNVIFRFSAEDDSTITETALDVANKTGSYNFTKAVGKVVIRVANGVTLTNFRLRPMLNAGTSALPWEPYSGGYASPSPDWAQPITSVGDGGSVTVNSVGANLFPALDVQGVTAGGATVRNNNDGSLTISRSVNLTRAISSSNKLNHAETVQRIKAGQYTISGAEPGQPYILASFLYNNDINIECNTKASSESSIEISQDALNDVSSYIWFGVYGRSGGTITQQTVWPMFNRGSTPLPWQPYVAPSSALITLTDSLRGIPVSSGGNYTDEDGQQWIADYIYRRVTDGKWCLWRNCGSIVYDGSEDEAWIQSSLVSYRFIINGSTSPALSAAIASSFKVSTKGAGDVGQFVVNDGNDGRYFNSNQNSLEAWKTWLSSNPQTVVYQLATPTVEELPENVQTELNGLYTYNLHTDMWNNDGAYMNLKYVADTKTWINNKIAGLSTAMIENL